LRQPSGDPLGRGRTDAVEVEAGEFEQGFPHGDRTGKRRRDAGARS
jgi:hypothetical protein